MTLSRPYARVYLIAITITLLTTVFLVEPRPVMALQGVTGAHDPSRITKCNGKYFYYCTGDLIPSRYSTDLVNWTAGPNVMTSIPDWARQLVPDNTGNSVWAPDVLYFNGLYHLYYAFSTFGSPVSVIGMMTSSTLDPSAPGYGWTDRGLIIASNTQTGYNCIDPCPVFDSSGNLWMSFGSWDNYGIGMIQLDPSTGLRLASNSTVYHLAGTGMEASYILAHGGYYYLFENIGACCRGTNSTYQVMIGRSTSIKGPYLDKSGKDLLAGGGTTFMSTAAPFIGPGQVGYYKGDDGVEYLTYHYYDGNANGVPTLGITHLVWGDDGWPVSAPDWIDDGAYKIVNSANGMVWKGGTGSSLDAITEAVDTGSTSEYWTFSGLGSGVYEITNAQGGLSVDAYNCSPDAGTKLDLYSYWGGTCQQWRIERYANGSYIIESMNGNRAVDIPNGVSVDGTQLQLFDGNGFWTQQWSIVTALPAAPTGLTATAGAH